MSEVFKPRDTPYINLWHTSQFSADPIPSVYNGIESAFTFHLVRTEHLKDNFSSF